MAERTQRLSHEYGRAEGPIVDFSADFSLDFDRRASTADGAAHGDTPDTFAVLRRSRHWSQDQAAGRFMIFSPCRSRKPASRGDGWRAGQERQGQIVILVSVVMS